MTLTPQPDFAPLAGITVLDFSHVIAGPFATFLLAQLGARITKVESAGGGDVMRRAGKGHAAFVALNAGKSSLALDLSDEAGREHALELAGRCDVFVDNLRPGVLERFGLGYEAVRARNPRVVYCSISGFGRGAAQWHGRPAYDHVVQAATGMAWMGGTEGDPPMKTGFPVIDSATGMLAAFAILAGVRESERTGRGMLLDVSMATAGLQLMYPMTCDAMTTGGVPARQGNQGYSGSPSADFFRTQDGWLAIGANTPKQLLALLDALGLGGLAQDPALFETPLDAGALPAFVRSLDPAALKRAIAGAVAAGTAEDLELRLSALGIPAARLRNIAEFAGESMANGSLRPVALQEGETEVLSPGLGFQVYRPV
ncbi:Crotonobetainyl-CoA:carnitine CoA-transferase CaiB [Cupriavidus necator]|uniref:CoA transferase n=1 Tax=Cupriavidus necator (strain ATCC 17699 / DSM 428 / KCTC 22496 / NCIMB 10442 / H16 / Stanier 337) TaxID=381666 RepID=Q0K7S9_CUPNH|nr:MULTISPECIES: CoA transferase [Cupriavidus]EON17206.1 acyl-CoA transferase [Cupriavidus sp. GA3-3]KUE90244.1 acyl-CoA transferase [Cupriavidus necator]QCC01714.1 CoA transferase [Cupriavidus necator H16]QQB75455.1 CoA transferase [Cupriavidus necator]WKA40111.1 CoA transferase [Cupriavidus necator]